MSAADAGEGRYTLVLAKEDFKFSSAHFTFFDAERAELLHGHNYRMRVELEGPELDAEGLLADIATIKRSIRAHCQRLDSLTLLPENSPHLEIERQGDGVLVRYRRRTYQFPADDVLMLPLHNTSIELLARYLWRQLAVELRASRVEILTVEIAETAGQSCAYRAPVSGLAAS